MKILFLFNNERSTVLREVAAGRNHGVGFWGMVHLNKYGVTAEMLELEMVFSPAVARFLRKYVFRSIYFVHAIFFPRFFKYDIIFTSSAFGSQLLHALWPFKKPLWVMHDFSITGFIGEARTLKQRLFRFLVRHADGIVTVGQEETEKLKRLFPHLEDRIEYIPFGVDINFFKPREDIQEKNQILAVGFDPDRDWKTLIEAVRDLPIEVVIATRPARVAHLMPLPPNVTLQTFAPRDLAREYLRSAIVVIPLDTSAGVNDAMGCSTLFEAMASGRAIVATRTHTFESYIEDGVRGLLVSERDVAQLRDAIERLRTDSSLRARLGASARQYAETFLDVEIVTQKLAAFFERLKTLGPVR